MNGVLAEASEPLGDVDPEGFGVEEDYWRAKRAIAEAGGIVVAEQSRRRRAVEAADKEARAESLRAEPREIEGAEEEGGGA